MVEWVKSGSALGAKMEINIEKKKNKLRLNKRASMNYILPEEVQKSVTSWPVAFAGSTEKFENGK